MEEVGAQKLETLYVLLTGAQIPTAPFRVFLQPRETLAHWRVNQ